MSFIDSLILHKAEIFLVGGAVRNLLYSKIFNIDSKIKDIDLVVRLLDIDKICKILALSGIVKLVGKNFGVLKFTEFGSSEEYDIALPMLNFV